MWRTNSRRNLATSVLLSAILIGAAPTSAIADPGGVVPGLHGRGDGAPVVAPLARGSGLRRNFVIGGPVLAPRSEVRYGHYGRPALGYGSIYYGAPSVVYEMPYQDRMYCPESRAYYPAVQECATPWLRMRPGGGVTADSPIPMPSGQPYGY